MKQVHSEYRVDLLHPGRFSILYRMEQLYCHEPLVNLNITSNLMFPCCESYVSFKEFKPYKIPSVIADTAWNSLQWKKFRKMIASGDHSLCHNCPLYMRRETLFKTAEQLKEQYGDAVYDFVTGKADNIPAPHTVLLSYDSTCNLACPTCRPGTFKQNPSLVAIYNLKAALPLSTARHVVIAGDGEVCMSKHYLNDLARVPADATITLMSNGTLLNENFWGRLAELGAMHRVVQVNISCDGTRKPVFEATRRNGVFETFMENMHTLMEMKTQVGFRTKMRYTVNTVNLGDYHNVPEFARQLGFDEIDISLAVVWERLVGNSVYLSENIITDDTTLAAVRTHADKMLAEY